MCCRVWCLWDRVYTIMNITYGETKMSRGIYCLHNRGRRRRFFQRTANVEERVNLLFCLKSARKVKKKKKKPLANVVCNRISDLNIDSIKMGICKVVINNIIVPLKMMMRIKREGRREQRKRTWSFSGI